MTLTEETAKELNLNISKLLDVIAPQKKEKKISKKAERQAQIKKALLKYGL